MKTNLFILFGLYLILMAGAFSSCNKNKDNQIFIEVENLASKQGSQNRDTPELRSSSSTTTFKSKFSPIYHYWEWTDRTDRKGLCGESSYMVALKTICSYNGKNYNLNIETQNHIDNNVTDSPNPYNLFNYWSKYDKSLVKCDFARGSKLSPDKKNWTTRTKIKEFIETALSKGSLVTMPVIINGRNADLWEKDNIKTEDSSQSEKKTKYISKYGNIGHWLVIYRIDVYHDYQGNVTGGLAYYVDVLESNPNFAFKSIDYSRLLDANRAAGSTHSAMWFDSQN